MKIQFAKISSAKKLSAKSIDAIINLIKLGQLKPGDRLPPQNVLAKDLGVSRTSLREALKELDYRGLVTSRHGRGTFVCDAIVSERETVEARRILEPSIAFMAARKGTPDDVGKLLDIVEQMRPRVRARQYQEFSDLDMEFHGQLARMARNKALEKLFLAVKDFVLHQQNVVQRIPGAINRAHAYHCEIVKAVADGDAPLAEEKMRSHLDDVAVTLAAFEDDRRR